jgi:hypothetical protein
MALPAKQQFGKIHAVLSCRRSIRKRAPYSTKKSLMNNRITIFAVVGFTL